MDKGKEIAEFCPECVVIPEIDQLKKKIELLEKENLEFSAKFDGFLDRLESISSVFRRDK